MFNETWSFAVDFFSLQITVMADLYGIKIADDLCCTHLYTECVKDEKISLRETSNTYFLTSTHPLREVGMGVKICGFRRHLYIQQVLQLEPAATLRLDLTKKTCNLILKGEFAQK